MLIRATLLPGGDAIDAWEAWLASARSSKIDAEEARLFPLLYHNLVEAGVGEERLGQYRKSWQRSRFSMSILHREAIGAARLLSGHAIPVVFLKGIALAHLYYREPGLRPMADFDLLVPRDSALRAAAILESSGWLARAPLTKDALDVSHGVEISRGGVHCDLHWSVMWEGNTSIDEEIREHAIVATIDGVDVRLPSHADQLLHVIVHGTRIGEGRMLRWVPDSHLVLTRAESAIDWGRFKRMVIEHELAWPVRDALLYLRDLAGTPVPEELIAQIPPRSPSALEKRVHSVEIERTGTRGALVYLPTLISRYRRMAGGGFAGRFRWIATAFGQAWGVSGARLPFELIRRGRKKIGQVLGIK